LWLGKGRGMRGVLAVVEKEKGIIIAVLCVL